MELDFLESLLKEESTEAPKKKYPAPEWKGPLKFYDNEMRCASRGCGSPTHWKLQGIPYCGTHCMYRMNDMLIEFGVE